MPVDWIKRLNPQPGLKWHGTTEAGWVEPNRHLYNHELVVFASGSGRVMTSSETFACEAGDTVVIPPDCLHCTVADVGPLERYCFHFDWEPGQDVPALPWVFSTGEGTFDASRCNHAPAWLPLTLPARRTFPALSKIRGPLEEMMAADPETPAGMAVLKGTLLASLAVFFGDTPAARRTVIPSAFLRAKELFDQDYRDATLNAGAVAAALRITPNHLCKLFRRELGISPLDYLHSLRLQAARRLIESGECNISEAAYACGFADANYFSRLFRAKTGAAPSATIRPSGL